MNGRTRRIPTLKYSILKPNQSITSLKRSFAKPHPRCGYEVALTADLALRRYRRVVESLEKVLQDCQWRFQEASPIVRCLYVQLLAPNSTTKCISVEVYVEDLEVALSKMKKLLLPQALYLIVQSVIGYEALWKKFKEVSIDEQTIGLNCKGSCLVWLNSSLEKNHCDDYKLDKPHEIVHQIVSLIRERSEPICDGMLLKLLANLEKKDYDFSMCLQVIESFAKNYQVKIPLHLGYLVNQERLYSNCKELITQQSINEDKQQLEIFKSRRYVFSRASLASDSMKSPKNFRKQGQKGNLLSTFRKTTSPNARFMTYRSMNRPHNESIDSSVRDDEFHKVPTRTFYESTVTKQTAYPFHHSRCKSHSNQCIQIINNIRAKKSQTARSIESNKKVKKLSGMSDKYCNKTKASNSEIDVEVSKKDAYSPQYKEKTYQPLGNLYSCKQFQSYECSPFVIKEQDPYNQNSSSNIVPIKISDVKFRAIPEFFRVNKWTPTLKNLMQASVDLNTSITEGQDTTSYLSDVRLQKLDTLSKHMVISLITQAHEKPLRQHHHS